MARDRPALSISLASCPLLIFTLRTSRTNLRMVVKDVCMADFMFAFFTMSLEGDLLEVEEFFERDATFLFNFRHLNPRHRKNLRNFAVSSLIIRE